jgi:hypothetical protein
VEELKRDEEEGLCESPRAEVAQAGCTSPSGFTSRQALRRERTLLRMTGEAREKKIIRLTDRQKIATLQPLLQQSVDFDFAAGSEVDVSVHNKWDDEARS